MFLVPVILLALLAGAQACTFSEEAHNDKLKLNFRTNKLGNILKLTDLELQLPAKFVQGCEKQLVLWTAACRGACPEPDWEEKTKNNPSLKDRKKPDPYLQWDIKNVVPCLTNHAKLCLNDVCIQAELAPASEQQMAAKKYSLGQVERGSVELQHTTTPEETLLVWEGIECATKYSVNVTNSLTQVVVGDADRQADGHQLKLSDLAPCTDYDFGLVPWVGDYKSNNDLDTVTELSTGPSKKSLDKLRVQDETNSTATIYLPTKTENSCVARYNLSVCRVEVDENCQTASLELVEGEEPTVPVTGLVPDTKWRVDVIAVGPFGTVWDLGTAASTFRTKRTTTTTATSTETDAKVVTNGTKTGTDTGTNTGTNTGIDTDPPTPRPQASKPEPKSPGSGSATAHLTTGLLSLGALLLHRLL